MHEMREIRFSITPIAKPNAPRMSEELHPRATVSHSQKNHHKLVDAVIDCRILVSTHDGYGKSFCYWQDVVLNNVGAADMTISILLSQRLSLSDKDVLASARVHSLKILHLVCTQRSSVRAVAFHSKAHCRKTANGG